MLVKIGEVAEQFDISNRTLRYWEEEGILKSIRMENGYRYYDEDNMIRIKQILMLRKLKISIQGIQEIFVCNELHCAVNVLQHHLDETKHEAEELKALTIILERMIEILKSKDNLRDIFQYLNVPNNSAIMELKNALQITLSERDNSVLKKSNYNKIGDVRIVNLPRMTVASYCAISETPENDCSKVMDKLVKDFSLQCSSGFRHFGFNNPGPTSEKSQYGYEMWVVVPEDFKVPEPFIRKEFPGGLYAALPTYMPIIGERWGELYEWVQNNDNYEDDWNVEDMRNELEECIDYITFNSSDIPESEKQLDLLLPIKRINGAKKNRKTIKDVMIFELEPKIVILPDITLGGCVFKQKDDAKLWKTYTPWYLLAQSIYKSGKDCMSHIKAGNNTFTLIYGEKINDKPFFLAGKQGVPKNVFCAVEIISSFESYPQGLEERKLTTKKYLVFSVSIPPEKATSKALPRQKLYNAATEYLLKHGLNVNRNFCLERDYRADGRKVDKVELYIPLASN